MWREKVAVCIREVRRTLAQITRVGTAISVMGRLGLSNAALACPALTQPRPFLDGFADRPAQQKCAQTALKAVEKWALARDLLPFPITVGTQAPGGTGGHVPWTEEQVNLAENHARPHLARAITLAANTSAAPTWSVCAGTISRK
jgi:hypothetical protein